MKLPESFKERMISILGGDEAERLFYAIEEEEAVKAFRVNRIKTDMDSFEAREARIDRKKADYPPEAYITREEFPGSLPCHHSGAVYMQDISAMSTVHAVKVAEGAYVLDSCSAPGGKTTQLAEYVGELGVVVANEYDKKRCRILQGNVERMGAKNTVICNLDTAVLSEVYPMMFDIVLCDAPCSGEGMFRKNERAVEEWSEENVSMCAERQREILSNVARCVKPGGKLVYSTCTFSLEENEENVRWFLDNHSEFYLDDAEDDLKAHTSDGIMLDGCDHDMKKCRRIYPHLSLGEGQFVAVLSRSHSDAMPESGNFKRSKKARNDVDPKKSRAELETLSAAHAFLEDNLISAPCGELIMLGTLVYISPKIKLPPYNVFSAGVCVGECVKGRIIPHHQLFSAYGKEFKLKMSLSGGTTEAEKYLCGEELSANGFIDSNCMRTSGWAAVMIDGCAVGGVKISGEVAKNHYPKGLRNNRL